MALSVKENDTLTLYITDPKLKILILSDKRIGDEGAIVLAKELATNTSVISVDLSFNEIGNVGAEALAKALKTNTSVISVDLSFNKIGNVGAEALAKAIKTNTTITTLSLCFNKFDYVVRKAFEKALQTNTTLTKLEMYYLEDNTKTIKHYLRRNERISNMQFWSPCMHVLSIYHPFVHPFHDIILVSLVCNNEFTERIPVQVWVKIFSFLRI